MNLSRTTNRLLLVCVLAFVGYFLVVVPPRIVEQYRAVSEAGPVWTYVYFAVVGTGGALLLGTTLWILWGLWRSTRRKKQQRKQHAKNPSELSRDEQEKEVGQNLAAVEELAGDDDVDAELKQELKPLVDSLEEKRESQQLEIVAFGTISGGKSSVLNALAGRDVFQTDVKGGTTVRRNEIPWPGEDRVMLVDTPGLGEIDGEHNAQHSAEAARDADIVLLVVDGPLRQSESLLLKQLSLMEKRVLICLNKEDWYDDHEKASLLKQIASQLAEHVDAKDIVAVRAKPTQRQRVRQMADGSENVEQVTIDADIAPIADRMMQIVRRDGHDLLLANLLLQSRGLIEEARAKVQSTLDARAWKIVDRCMWGAGGAAALSPLPLLDLAAGGAITTKMVIDLARVYRQEIDFETAAKLLAQLGKNLISILGVSAVSPAVAAGVASLLKTVPGAGTIAGGMLQGVVQAIVTRWVGAVFIEYFKNEMQQPEGGLAGLARRQWNHVTSIHELRKLIQSARDHLTEEENDHDS